MGINHSRNKMGRKIINADRMVKVGKQNFDLSREKCPEPDSFIVPEVSSPAELERESEKLIEEELERIFPSKKKVIKNNRRRKNV